LKREPIECPKIHVRIHGSGQQARSGDQKDASKTCFDQKPGSNMHKTNSFP
jgi:hypothetical protein